MIEAISKIEFWFKVKAAPRFNPQAYFKHSEELKQGSNTETGPKEFIEIAPTSKQ